jgi:quinol monooxygenase YgiN
MSLVVVATVFPLPECRDEVVEIFEQTIIRVHKDEPGCELYALHENDDCLVMIEKWASDEAMAVHGRGAALSELKSRLEGKLASPLVGQRLRPHPAGSDRRGSL